MVIKSVSRLFYFFIKSRIAIFFPEGINLVSSLMNSLVSEDAAERFNTYPTHWGSVGKCQKAWRFCIGADAFRTILHTFFLSETNTWWTGPDQTHHKFCQ